MSDVATTTQQLGAERTAHSERTFPLAWIVGAFFALRLVIAVFVIRVLGGEPQLASEIKLALSFTLVAIVAFATIGSYARTIRSLMRSWNIRWVAIFLAFSLCSFAWGEAASPLGSLVYWCGTLSDVLVVALLMCAEDSAQVAASLLKGFIAAACIVALVAWLMPAEYDLRLGDEDYFNANSIGNICALAVLFAQYLSRSSPHKRTLTTAFLAITLLRSLSKTTIVAFVVCEIYLLIQDRTMTRRTKLLLTASSFVVILAFWGLFEAYFDEYTSHSHGAETLTGRTVIWVFAVEGISNRPWFGHGFDSMWKIAPTFSGTFEARHTENEVLEQLYSYGIAGLAIFIGVYTSLYRAIRKYAQPRVRAVLTAMVIFAVVRGLAEAEPFDLLLPLWAITLFGALVLNPAMGLDGFE